MKKFKADVTCDEWATAMHALWAIAEPKVQELDPVKRADSFQLKARETLAILKRREWPKESLPQ